MPAVAQRHRSVWDDRFHAPAANDLIVGIDKQWRSAVTHARAVLLRDEDIREQIAWQGVWKWTLTFRHAGVPERAWAYLIPDPAKPRLCVPMSEAAVDGLSVSKTPKFVRESLAFAPIVDGVRWPVWELQTRQQTDGILGLLASKHGALLGSAK
jgi:hypothetical protein